MDNNRVMVMDQGKIVEFDSPNNLLESEDSIFYSMAKESGLIIENTITPVVTENKRHLLDIFKDESSPPGSQVIPTIETGMPVFDEDETLSMDLVSKNESAANDNFDQVDGTIPGQYKNNDDQDGYATAEEEKTHSSSPPPSPVEEQDHFSDS